MSNQITAESRVVAKAPLGERLAKGATSLVFWLLLLCGVAIVLLPFYWMVTLSLTPGGQSTTPGFGWFPDQPTLENYRIAIVEKPVTRWLLNSTLVALVAATASCLVGATSGYVLSRFKFQFKGAIVVTIMLCQLIPQVSVVIPMYSVFRTVGLLNTFPGVMLAHIGWVTPLIVWLTKGFFDQIPPSLDEAARVDGAGRFRTFWTIDLPLALPGLGAAFMYAFVVSWNDLIFARTLVATSQSLWTAPVGLASFHGEYYTTIESMLAAAVLFALPVVLMFVFFQKSFVAGLTGGGVKG